MPSSLRLAVVCFALGAFGVLLPAAAWPQAVEKVGQAEVPVLEDNLDNARARALHEAQAQAVGLAVADLVAPEWVTLYDRELRRRIYARVERYISAYRPQRLEASADRTRYAAAVTAQVARGVLLEDLREMGLPILSDPRKTLRVLFPAGDPVLGQPGLRAAVLDVLRPRLELLGFQVTGFIPAEPAAAEWLRDAASDNPRRADYLARQRQDALLYLAFRLPAASAPSGGVEAVLYQGAGGYVLADLGRQTQTPRPSDTRLKDYILTELVQPLALQLQPGAVRAFRPAGGGTRLALRVTGFTSVSDEEAFESAFFRRNSPFANFTLHRIEPDAVVYQGTFSGNREALDRDLPGRQVGDFTIGHATWMDSLLELSVRRSAPPQHLEPELFPVERRPPQVAEVLQGFFARAGPLEVQDPYYAEREDNGWLDRANQLPFNATVYGQVDSRGDADFYVGEHLAEGELLDVIWYRVDRTNLVPVIRLHDGNARPVRSYTPRAYTRFTYRIPAGQHAFYLEIADRFGHVKADGSGYQKFHYLLLVKRQSNR